MAEPTTDLDIMGILTSDCDTPPDALFNFIAGDDLYDIIPHENLVGDWERIADKISAETGCNIIGALARVKT